MNQEKHSKSRNFFQFSAQIKKFFKGGRNAADGDDDFFSTPLQRILPVFCVLKWHQNPGGVGRVVPLDREVLGSVPVAY